MRLDKYLADMDRGTRSELKRIIRKGRVQVNGTVVKDPGFALDETTADVLLDGEPVVYQKNAYILMNKPAGVVSATKDPQETTVLDLLGETVRRDLFPVGRLDKDTEGLLLLTNDGALAHRLLSPKKHVDKVYFAKLDGPLSEDAVRLIEEGIEIRDEEPFRALPAKISLSEDRTEARLTIREGKFHQVKRMFAAAGRKVLYLKRLSMGPLSLDAELHPGEWRYLTGEEKEMLILPPQGP